MCCLVCLLLTTSSCGFSCLCEMAADLFQSLRRPSVRRCLFGRPVRVDDEFSQACRQAELDAARRFQAKWNIDVCSENDIINDGEYVWVKSASHPDIPDFYKRGFAHKGGRRPCVGKSLQCTDSDEEGSCSPVQCLASSSTTLFLGLRLPHQPPHDPVTPPACATTTSITAGTLNNELVHSDSEQRTPSPVRMSRSLSQTRLTGKLCSHYIYLINVNKCSASYNMLELYVTLLNVDYAVASCRHCIHKQNVSQR